MARHALSTRTMTAKEREQHNLDRTWRRIPRIDRVYNRRRCDRCSLLAFWSDGEQFLCEQHHDEETGRNDA